MFLILTLISFLFSVNTLFWIDEVNIREFSHRMKTTSSFFTKFRQFCKRSCISVVDDNMRKWCWYQRNENALKIIHTKTQIVRTLILDRLTRWTGVTLNVRLFYSVFEKVLILLYVERKHKKKDKDRVSLISELWYGFPPVLLLTFNFFFYFSW